MTQITGPPIYPSQLFPYTCTVAAAGAQAQGGAPQTLTFTPMTPQTIPTLVPPCAAAQQTQGTGGYATVIPTLLPPCTVPTFPTQG